MTLLDTARKSTAVRIAGIAKNIRTMTEDEVVLLNSLLDEYGRKTKAWRREAWEAREATITDNEDKPNG